VKARETSEVSDCDSLKPKMTSSKPAAISAMPIAVFMVSCGLGR
jgi:hypothetical protein